MKPSKIFDILDLAVRARKEGEIFNPLLVSPPGLGKTEIAQQWAKSRNLKTIVMTLSSYDPPDFKGYPITQLVNGKQRLTFATPDFWPDEGEGIIILEELNRSQTSIMQCILSLTDSRRGFDGYRLPDGWVVMGCINPEGGEYDVNTMDAALKDRFEMFPVGYDKENFVNFMKSSEWDNRLVTFVESGIWSYSAPEDIKNVPGAKYLSPRSMSKLNASLKAGFDPEDGMLIFGTILGTNTGKDFYSFLHNESPVFYVDLVTNLENSLAKLKKFSDPANFKNGMISLTLTSIVEEGNIEDELLVVVLKTIPMEQGTVLIRDLELVRKEKSGTILLRVYKKYPELKKHYNSVLTFGK